MTPGLEVSDVTVLAGGTPIVSSVSLVVQPGTIVGLIGPNGAGKTTLIDAITGFVDADGSVRLNGGRLDHLAPHARARRGLGRTFQSLELFEDLAVVENLRVAAESSGRKSSADAILRRLGLDHVADRLPGTLSHAERKLLALGRALACAPEILLLDEPAAGLDAAQRRTLAGLLRDLAADGSGVLLVDHDMGLVFEVCHDVCVLQRGAVLAAGPAAEVREDPRVLSAYLGVRAAIPPVEREPVTQPPLLSTERLTAGYDGVPVLHDLSISVCPGEVVALLGPNGAGKTTVLSVVAGLLRPTTGGLTVLGGGPDRPERVARRGLTLVPQGRGLFLRLTAGENLRLARSSRPVEEVLQHFPELWDLLGQRVGELSGGQQQQLALARALLTRSRLLLVDELSMGLAPQVVDELLRTLRRVCDEEGVGVLLVEQHVPLALGVADRGYVLQRGDVRFSGTSAQILAQPDLLAASYFGG